MRTREAHLQWCKDGALECWREGRLTAWASSTSIRISVDKNFSREKSQAVRPRSLTAVPETFAGWSMADGRSARVWVRC
jgi:hypothetical protein